MSNRGRRPFAVLPDSRIIDVIWEEVVVSQGPGWSPVEQTRYVFELEGAPFRLRDAGTKEESPYLCLSEKWRAAKRKPKQLVAVGPSRFRVKLTDYTSHHLGSVSSTIEIDFDVVTRVAEVRWTNQVDID